VQQQAAALMRVPPPPPPPPRTAALAATRSHARAPLPLAPSAAPLCTAPAPPTSPPAAAASQSPPPPPPPPPATTCRWVGGAPARCGAELASLSLPIIRSLQIPHFRLLPASSTVFFLYLLRRDHASASLHRPRRPLRCDRAHTEPSQPRSPPPPPPPRKRHIFATQHVRLSTHVPAGGVCGEAPPHPLRCGSVVVLAQPLLRPPHAPPHRLRATAAAAALPSRSTATTLHARE
jgi:hypothetical protein